MGGRLLSVDASAASSLAHGAAQGALPITSVERRSHEKELASKIRNDKWLKQRKTSGF